MKVCSLILLAMLGSAAIAAEPALTGILADRTKPVDICGLHAPSLDQVADTLVEKGGVREAGGNETYVAYESLHFSHIWTFTRLGHPAHPAVICRELKGGAAGLEMSMHFVCGGAPAACTALYRDFVELNAEIKVKTKKP